MAEGFYHTPSERSLNCFSCKKKVKWNALQISIQGKKKYICGSCADEIEEMRIDPNTFWAKAHNRREEWLTGQKNLKKKKGV